MKTCPTCKSNHSDHYSHCPLDGTPLVEASLWTDGAVIRGKYRILGKIGQGGMGAVYKAQHVRFKEVCAIKVMAPELMKDPVFLKRFEHEAVLTRKLQHPNAVRVEDFDEAEDGRPFIVMEYIEGRSLKEVIAREAPMPVARVCSIAKQVASALDAAHRLGMVHRDIKPDNIVLLDRPITQSPDHPMMQSPDHPMTRSSDDPIAKVLDFGIAKMKEGLLETTGIGMTLTGTGMAIGTPSYMSPEQALGKKGDELDGRSDIYSLGVVMYQMLTGELPLQADTPIQMLMAHIQTPPRPLRLAHGVQISETVSRLVMQCLSKNPDERPANPKTLIEKIEYFEDEPARQEAARGKVEEEHLARNRAEEERRRRLTAEAERLAYEASERERPQRERAEAEDKIRPTSSQANTSRFGRWAAAICGVLVVGLGVWFLSRGSGVKRVADRSAAQAAQANSASSVATPTFATGAAGAQTPASTLDRPGDLTDLKPLGYVNDFASVLSPDARAKLTSVCSELDQKTHAQIAVVTIHTLHGEVLEEFSKQLASRWGVGDKANRGVLILLVVDEHRYRVEVGYGLEATLPDNKVSRLAQEMVPALRRADYDNALIQLTSSLASVIAQSPVVGSIPPGRTSANGLGDLLGYLIDLCLLGVLGWVVYRLVRRLLKQASGDLASTRFFQIVRRSPED